MKFLEAQMKVALDLLIISSLFGRNYITQWKYGLLIQKLLQSR